MTQPKAGKVTGGGRGRPGRLLRLLATPCSWGRSAHRGRVIDPVPTEQELPRVHLARDLEQPTICSKSSARDRAVFAASRQLSRCSEEFTNGKPMNHKGRRYFRAIGSDSTLARSSGPTISHPPSVGLFPYATLPIWGLSGCAVGSTMTDGPIVR